MRECWVAPVCQRMTLDTCRVGACAPHQRELDTAVVAASHVYTDSLESLMKYESGECAGNALIMRCSESGAIITAQKEGVSLNIVGEIGAVLNGDVAGR